MMIIGATAKRNWFVGIFLNLIPDIVIAIVVAELMGGGTIGFVAVLAFLFFAPLFFAIKQAIWNWILFFAAGRKAMQQEFIDFLFENKFPEPEEYFWDVDDYLVKTLNDKDLPVKTRLAAAGTCGEFNMIRMLYLPGLYMRMSMMMEAAIKEYKRSFTRSSQKPSDKSFDDDDWFDDDEEG